MREEAGEQSGAPGEPLEGAPRLRVQLPDEPPRFLKRPG